MPKPTSQFVCQSCGTIHGKWAGRCDACGEWNTLVEETVNQIPGGKAGRSRKKGRQIDFVDLGGESADLPRMRSGIAELDRVTGGGLVPGSAILVGGDPGIGKSTLLLQACGKLAASGFKTAYISGEESAGQVQRRAKRLEVADAPVALAAETSLGPILDALMAEQPDIVIIDSIQTLWTDQLGRRARHSRPGPCLRPGTHPVCQKIRRLRYSCWPCDQRRPDCRAARGRAYGRCGPVF